MASKRDALLKTFDDRVLAEAQLPEMLKEFNPSLSAVEVHTQLTNIRNALASLLEAVDELRAEVRKEIHH